MIQTISSKQNNLIKEVVKLSNSSFRKEKGMYKVDGFHMFEMANESDDLLYVFTTKKVDNLDDKIPQYIVTEDILKKMSSSITPQGIVSVCKIKAEKPIKSERVLYLDGVSDPGNLGTLLRTALAFGYNDVILSENCCSIYNEKAIQSSQGAIFKLNILNNSDLSTLKKNGYTLLATEIKGSKLLNEIVAPKKHVLILGNEAHGVSQKVLEIADERIRIDIKNIESLNVAIAGAIAMYSLSLF